MLVLAILASSCFMAVLVVGGVAIYHSIRKAKTRADRIFVLIACVLWIIVILSIGLPPILGNVVDPRTVALIIKIVGYSMVALGGGLATYLTIKDTEMHAERILMVRASIVVWMLVIVFIILPLTFGDSLGIPYWLYFLWFLLFWAFIEWATNKIDKRRANLRQEKESPTCV